MAKISMSDISPELTPEELQELEAAEKMPVIFDEDCPEMTEKMLQQFHRMDSVVVNFPGKYRKSKIIGTGLSFYSQSSTQSGT